MGGSPSVGSVGRGQQVPALGNLPLPSTSFVGREHEMDVITRLVARSRLVTLTGAGGIGKTRLALEVAQRLAGRFANGAWYVELAPVTSAAAVPSVVLASLKVRRRPGPTAKASLVETLAGLDSLVVLDNCEHLLDSVADLASSVLRRCESLRILATSREVLNVDGETTLVVSPMEVPRSGHRMSSAALGALASVQLFMERANAARPGITLTAENGASIGRICRRVDGIPLAIELAAARTRGLPITVIADRLDARFELLVNASRTAPERHRTLRDTLDWSYQLLSAREQELFRDLSVFRGGFTLEAVEAVCSRSPGDRASAVADELTILIDKSLVILEESGDRPARFRLLEPVREYSQDQLASVGEIGSIAQRHAAYYIELADTLLVRRSGPDRAWFIWAASELDNLRAAYDWAVVNAPHAALQLSLALTRYWMLREGGEGRLWLDRALAACPTRDEARAEGLRTASFWATLNGDLQLARPLADESWEVALERGSLVHQGFAKHAMALIACTEQAEEPPADALRLFSEAEDLVRRSGDRWALALLLNNFGYILCRSGDLAAATRMLRESVAISRELDDDILTASVYGSMADAEFATGNRDAAEKSWKGELEKACAIGALTRASEALNGLGRLASEDGLLMRALTLLAAASEFARQGGAQIYSPDDSLIQNVRERARSVSSHEEVDEAWSFGAGLSLDEAAHFVFSEPNVDAPLPATAAAAERAGIRVTENVIAREGDYWAIGFGGRIVRAKDSKGLQDLALLLSNPGSPIGCMELASAAAARNDVRMVPPRDSGFGIDGSAGPILDAQARDEYRQRLIELEDELAQAERDNNPVQADQLRDEREALVEQLRAAMGFGGRPREDLDPAERARKAVTARIRDAMARLEALHSELGNHLRHSIRTGTFCVYDPPAPTTWRSTWHTTR